MNLQARIHCEHNNLDEHVGMNNDNSAFEKFLHKHKYCYFKTLPWILLKKLHFLLLYLKKSAKKKQ